MNERLVELKQLWDKHFEGQMSPAESSRLSELMSDATLMEAFSESQALEASAEVLEPMDASQWSKLDARVMRAFRRQHGLPWLKPLGWVLAASMAVASGIWMSSESGPSRPDLGSGSEAFEVVSRPAQQRTKSQQADSSHEVHSAKISVVVDQAHDGEAKVDILDAAGQEVAQLYSGNLKHGQYRYVWNGMNSQGRKVSPGAYTIKIKTSSGVEKRHLEIRQKK
jgi:hypothetical protein